MDGTGTPNNTQGHCTAKYCQLRGITNSLLAESKGWNGNTKVCLGQFLDQKILRKVKNYPHFCFSNLFTQK
jgi:hypothetical protein